MLHRNPRFLILVLNLVCGLMPSAAFFVWVERNCSLPFAARELGWPWVSLLPERVPVLAVWNLLLILLFGVIHSATAQRPFHRFLERFLPPQATRSIYLALSGLALVALMGLWQSTRTLLWALSLSPIAATLLSALPYYALLCGGPLWIMQRFDGCEFLGFRQISQSRSRLDRVQDHLKLQTDGIYARVRHPIYLFTLLAFFLTPVMSLDRFLVFLGTLLYLAWGIPVEEKKLITIFRADYLAYQKKVPALIPNLKR